MFPIAQRFVERVVLVPDDAIRTPSAGCGGAAHRRRAGRRGRDGGTDRRMYRPAPGERVAVLLCGANTGAVDFDRAGS